MIKFLTEAIFLLFTKNKVITRISLRLPSDHSLKAKVFLATLRKNTLAREIKSPTYHQLLIGKKRNRWEGKVYFDL
jgi:SHS2 domain-containing protein